MTSLKQYLVERAERRKRPSAGTRWFAVRQSVAGEVRQALAQGAPLKTTWEWLRDVHGFPYSPSPFYKWVEDEAE